jgi:hypothetical protein
VLLHQGRNSSNFLFGDRTVTVSSRSVALTPSSVIVETSTLPEAKHGFFEAGTFKTESYSVKLGRSTDMSLKKGVSLDVASCKRAIRPHVQARERSISTALLFHLGEVKAPSGLEGFVVRRQADILTRSKSESELASGLIGLGYGLTPSGDDFLVGMSLVKHLLGCDLSPIRKVALQYPNWFSRTMLLDAVDGHYSTSVRAMGEAMTKHENIDRRASELLGLGHSSGSDTLAGVWYALSETPDNACPELIEPRTTDIGRFPEAQASIENQYFPESGLNQTNALLRDR